ncbi:mannose-1-phosphate guanylyltransferase/mannose-6-phosphate isomerase [Oceanicoccus sp. KOV_DT_Chl]|uniref:mannose-1-phosphate guanylyltransferase/mannose-6-phosphate isomerase n=1 Tax=Oceanicoccus sp. KOV_DT_Chl TaxID=1904639 RepID=UPI000C7961D6|nr:mannose-1-phosphate guanylyltransferase/mannose-6-phosphate isomerase [Oceanicoccus sp. KOV_DT_Chl]
MLIPVVLSGGVGSRLWPLSRELNPKQFLPLAGDLSMLAETLQRSAGLEAVDPIVVCNQEHRFLVAEELRSAKCQANAIILEPVGRNTAPAVAAAALQALKQDAEAVLLVMPADHIVKDVAAFAAAVEAGLVQAKQGSLVTFGIVPASPETGYGYIRRGDQLVEGCYPLAEFVEKPSADVAQQYVTSGDYFWNSGMFLLSAQSYLDELKQFAPEMLLAVQTAFDQGENDLDFIRLEAAAFEACPSDSIDYAVMEHTKKGMVVPLSCGWSDVGAWSSLWDVAEKDASGNVAKGDTILHNTGNSYIHSNSRLVTTVGVDNIVVVETADAVLVADKDQVQDVKAIVNTLKAQQRDEVNSHTKVYRPWGSYESLAMSERFQVKRIIVTPGQKLSLQLHHHRAEHWIVVSGTAVVTCGEKEFILSEDQSTYIPLGTKHRLANTGVIPLELIEVQSGSYLGEDDIVRFEDVYGRSK